jgi:hypothetical protein
MAVFGLGLDVLRQTRRWNGGYLPGAFRCVHAAQKYSGPIDRGESRQVGNEPSERGPLDALPGACRVVRRLSKHCAVRRGRFAHTFSNADNDSPLLRAGRFLSQVPHPRRIKTCRRGLALELSYRLADAILYRSSNRVAALSMATA